MHDTIIEERTATSTPEAVFAALGDAGGRPGWAVPRGEGLRVDALDLRTGGVDRFECGPAGELGMHVEVEHLLVDAPRLVADRERVSTADGTVVSASLVTWEIEPAPEGVRIRETVQVVSLVGPGMIEGTRAGTAMVLDQLVAHLEENAGPVRGR